MAWGLLFLLFSALVLSPCDCKQPKKILKRSDGKKWAHTQFEDFEEDLRGKLDLYHLKGEAFAIPIEIDVVLVGFGGDGGFQYKMDAPQLERLLFQNYPIRRPHSRETGEPLASEFHLMYNVYTAPEEDVMKVEDAIKSAMVKGGKYNPVSSDIVWGFDNEAIQTYNVEATKLEPVLDQLVDRAFDDKYMIDELSHWQTDMAIIVLNPSKRRMNPSPPSETSGGPRLFSTEDWDKGEFDVQGLKAEEGEYLYQYQYNGAGKSQTWLAAGSYLVIDISAGPCNFGPQMSAAGSVSPLSVPRIMPILFEGASALTLHRTHPAGGAMDNKVLKDVAQARDTFYRGNLAATIISAVNHVILPDIWVENVQDSLFVTIPVMLLRNHLDSNVVVKGTQYTMFDDWFSNEIYRMMGSTKTSMAIFSSHSLHEHRQLAIAVHKASHTKSDSIVLESGYHEKQQGFHSRKKTFLDSEVLLNEFEHADDRLTQGWTGAQRSGTARDKRVLPIYILSLKDAPFNLVLDNNGLVTGDDKMVIALQTISSYDVASRLNVDTFHRAQDERVTMSTVDIRRHVLAGLATSLMGIAPPYESMSEDEPGKVVEDWLWATGHTPFGPYSNTTTLSELTVTVAHRNVVIASIERIMTDMKGVLSLVGDYLNEYMCPPFDELGMGHGGLEDRNLTWVDRLYKRDPSSSAIFAQGKAAKDLDDILAVIEASLHELAHAFYDGDHLRLKEILLSLKTNEQHLRADVMDILSEAKNQMTCCQVVHRFPVASSSSWLYLVLLFLVICALVLFWPAVSKNEHGPLLAFSNRNG